MHNTVTHLTEACLKKIYSDKIPLNYLTIHSRGIAESNIFLTCHLFHKLHNLRKQKTKYVCCRISEPIEIIIPHFHIQTRRFQSHHLRSQTSPPCSNEAEDKVRESVARVKIRRNYNYHIHAIPTFMNMTSVQLITRCETMYECITDCII